MFFSELIIGTFMVCLTVAIHAVILDRILVSLEHVGPAMFKRFRRFWKIPVLILAVLGTFCSHILQIWIWALFYYLFTELSNFETALYFSTTTFTTVGYGDVVLTEEWRLIGSFQSANGFMLFGWSTAFIFEIMSKLYQKDRINQVEVH